MSLAYTPADTVGMKQSQIDEWGTSLNIELNRARELSVRMVEKFDRVLRPASPGDDKPTESTPRIILAPMAETLRAMTLELRFTNDATESTISRAEL